jgi:ABC-type transport system substrate-binding protein
MRRRASLRLPASALAALSLAAACGGAATPTTSVVTTTTTTVALSSTTTITTPATTSTTTSTLPGRIDYGGEVVIGVLEEPSTLNWFAGGGESAALGAIGVPVWAGVFKVDGETLELVPDVVVELPSVANGGLVLNPDGTETVRYEIDPLAVWSDGTPISGADLAFTYESIMNPEYATDKSGYDLIIPESIQAGPKSFEFTLVQPSLVVESLFRVILPQHVVAGTDLMEGWNDRIWVSGGPFEFEQWVKGEYLTLTRNPNYWKVDEATGQQLPYLDRVVVRFVPDLDTLIAQFGDRELDVIAPGFDVALLDELGALPGASVDVAGTGQLEHLAFQFGDGRLVRNPGSYNEHLEYRLAVAHALDRDLIAAELLGGWGGRLDSYLDVFTPAWSSDAWARYEYDPDQARAYIAALCAKEGVDCAAKPPAVVFTSQAADIRIALSEVLEPMFTDVGISYRAQIDPALLFFGDTLDFGRYDVAGFSWTGDPGLAPLVRIHGAWDPDAVPPFGLAFSRWGSPAVAGQEEAGYNQGASSVIDDSTRRYRVLMGLMSFTADEEELRTYVAEAETILAEALVFIPLFQIPDAGVVWGDEISGYRHYPPADTWNIATWHRADG